MYFTIRSVVLTQTTQLLIVIPGTSNQFDVVTELLAMQAANGTMTGPDLHERLSTTLNDISYSATS